MAEEKANTLQPEVLALAIDRATSAELSRINKEIGTNIYVTVPSTFYFRRYQPTQKEVISRELETVSAEEHRLALLGKDSSYESLLHEYVRWKLYLHRLRRTLYYQNDAYAEREEEWVPWVLERCEAIRAKLKEHRRAVSFAAWGDLDPVTRSAYDKPLLYAMDEYTCSFVINEGAPEEEDTTFCPLAAEHWYHGNPYCRAHLNDTRRKIKQARRRGERWVRPTM